MDTNTRPTRVDDLDLPVEMVTLRHMRSRDGRPVVVGVEAIDEMAMAKIMKALPGDRPRTLGVDDAAPTADPDEGLRDVERILAVAVPLIEAATFLDHDGEDVRPAFWFTSKRHPKAIRGSLLRLEDKMVLAEAIMRIGGYLGGASKASFPDGRRGGSGDGVGAVPTIQGDGDATVGVGVVGHGTT